MAENECVHIAGLLPIPKVDGYVAAKSRGDCIFSLLSPFLTEKYMMQSSYFYSWILDRLISVSCSLRQNLTSTFPTRLIC